MRLPFPGIGIVFDIDALGGGFYGYQAWRIFMRNIDQAKLTGCILLEGDTNKTLRGGANEFCIAVYGMNLDPGYIKKVFGDLKEKGLAPKNRRFIEKPELDSEPLPKRGMIDALGIFTTESWTRIDHDLCKEAGWRYKPESIPDDLPLDLRSELDKLMKP